MADIPDLASLGPRIMICGMSSAGKSTLTSALARKIGAVPVYLDTLYHQPGTAWKPRPVVEFEALHAAAIAGESWVMDGNYSRTMEARLAQATAIVWIDGNRFACLWRYFKRSFFERSRHGRLEGAVDSFTWLMVNHIMIVQPASRAKLDALFAASGLPLVRIESMGELRRHYESWGLK